MIFFGNLAIVAGDVQRVTLCFCLFYNFTVTAYISKFVDEDNSSKQDFDKYGPLPTVTSMKVHND